MAAPGYRDRTLKLLYAAPTLTANIIPDVAQVRLTL